MKIQPSAEVREQLFQDIQNGELDIANTLKRMRKIVGMTQAEYARLVGVAPRIIIDLERGVGNPTLKSLEKCGKPFGLRINYIHRTPS